METLMPPTRQARAKSIITIVAISLGIILLLLPSGTFAWQYRSMPQLGAYHDDAVYWVSALSLARGEGYKIAHLPEQPAQTKYPPLYPALLSLVWRFTGSFPQNLNAVAALQWCFVPLVLAAAWLYFRKYQFTGVQAYVIVLVMAVGPMTAIFATAPMTELPFTAVILAVLLLIEARDELSVRRALLAGMLAAAAFLIRTNALAFAVSVPFLLVITRKYRPAVAFMLPLAAATAGWLSWCAAHAYPSHDNILSYYTSYVNFYIRTFSLSDLPQRVWVNADALIEALAGLILFTTGQELWIRVVAWVMTAVATAGTVILFRRGLRHYCVFAVVFIVLLLFWQYPPDKRFVYPLLPLYIAGLVTKLTEIGKLAVVTWRTGGGANRSASVVALSMTFLVAGGSAVSMVYGLGRVLPAYFEDRQQERAQMLPVYRWIAASTRAGERFAAYDDALLYLYAGRSGYTVPILPTLVYDNDPEAISNYVYSLPELWREKQVTYLLVTRGDFQRDFHTPAQDALNRLVQDRSRFQPLYKDAIAQVYRLVNEPETLPSR
jgi:hypothetical protein